METILVIEDDEGLSRGIYFTLNKEGYQVLMAQDLLQGAQLVHANPVDLILLDLNLPDGDGLEFCKEIRYSSSLPIIILTARDLETDEIIGFEAGADDYITKPFSLSVLKARISALLRRSLIQKEEVPQYKFEWIISGRIRLCKDNCRVFKDMEEIDLSTTEYKLLKILRTGEQAVKMEWLMQALFKTSRLETGIIEFDIFPTYIKETIADSISSVYSHAESKNIHITIDEFEDRKLLHNHKWTTEAISNILENAIKYSPEGSEIKIKIEPMELYTKILVSDQGIGIASEEYNHIFKRFYRSKQVDQQEGSGLGLYLSQLILSKEGGYITVSSVLGNGSCFSMFLQNVRETSQQYAI